MLKAHWEYGVLHLNMYRTMFAVAALARVGTAFAPTLRAAPRSVAARAKYTAADGTPIKAALSAYMFFCNDARVRVTAEEKEKAGAAFKQTLVMTKLGALWRELPDAEKAGYQNQAKEDKVRYDESERTSTGVSATRRAGVPSRSSRRAASAGSARPATSASCRRVLHSASCRCLVTTRSTPSCATTGKALRRKAPSTAASSAARRRRAEPLSAAETAAAKQSRRGGVRVGVYCMVMFPAAPAPGRLRSAVAQGYFA